MSAEATNTTKSLIQLVSGADIVVQFTILILVLASIWSWTIIFHKCILVSYVSKRTKNFERNFSKKNINKIFDNLKNHAIAPIEQIFVTAMKTHKEGNYSTAALLTKNRCIDKLDQGLNYLATIAAAAPFIGLFGTVWGIMHSFQSIAASKNTSLAIVAPGIAEALFATGLGLAAAIPALVFYNILNAKIDRIEDNSDNFLIEIDSILK
jgi:biopolymer transport protein TolQ